MSRAAAAILAAMIAFLALVVLETYTLGRVLSQQDHLKRVTQDLQAEKTDVGYQRVALVEACQRLQILRAEDNVSHLADFRSFGADLLMFRLVHAETKAQERLLPAPQRRSTAAFLVLLSRAIVQKQRALGAKSWVPLTNCRRAVSLHGAHYKSPRPVRFVERLPARSELTVPPGTFR